MPRPPRSRRVTHIPGITYFKPRGIPMSSLKEVILTIDEFEALRLADLEALSHEEAAKKMKISRATFGRIIEKARRTVADALVNGKAIRIEGSNYRTGNMFEFRCRNCNRSWQFPIITKQNKNCPRCKQKGLSR
ncbi:MAG: DUF134 domain-containing protein [Bacteroidota bacterium]|nr:DUF134 domain-containing protein [Bacteroidota bacterium]